MIREMISEDSSSVLEIYKMGIDTHISTFETDVPSWTDWDSNHLKHSRFVYTDNEKVLGWVALSPVSSRSAYKGVAEVSIYVDTQTQGEGIGSLLMEKVISSSEEHGIWTLFSSVFPENKATLRLHEKYNFRIIGTRERIAQINGKWRDTIQMERRSKKTGI
jgi:L-amino acid N-acyltransferase YncA